MSDSVRRVLLIAMPLSCVLGLFLAVPPGASAAEADPGKLMLVLDSSGSMAEPASGGGTKIDAAKQALDTVIGRLPDNAPVGLRVYGSKVFSRTDAGACTDSERVVDIGTGNRDQLRSAVASYQPYGETPIGYALQEAGKDLGADGKRSIVLVSDGEPTCPPDPCEVAKQLSQQGVDLRIDVVGLDVSGNAAAALRCIAKAGHGTYYDVGSAEDLVDALATLATRAVRPYEPTGQPVTGGTTAVDAATIGAGSYVDQLGGPGTVSGVRTYAVERAYPGSALTVSASIRTPALTSDEAGVGDSDGLRIELTGEDGSSCDADSPATMRSMDSSFVVATVTDDRCADAERLDLAVSRADSGQAFTTPLELVVTEELPVADEDSLPTPTAPAWVAPPGGKATDSVVGGTSFATAAPLAPGVYRGTLVPNEIQVFNVDLDWGQQLTATMTIGKPSGKLADELSPHGSPFRLDLFSPARSDARAFAEDGAAETWSLYPSRGGTSGGTTATVAYRNRAEFGNGVAASSQAGAYAVTVSLVDARATASYEVPFVLRVGVSGEITEAPTFVTPTPSPTASASTSTEPSESASQTPSASPTPGDDTAASDESSDDGGLPGVAIGLAGVVLLVVLVGGYLLIRRTRPAQK
ncbi:vWA domain-containing protein [Nocardioides sp.]|uniref:vWA domain-containing protein n=1 Tax=Nocardioides sp. TaxID=35761 RepID=UPI0039E3E62B